jgi:hypothetical protein
VAEAADMSEQTIQQVMQTAMAAEDHRRQVTSQMPGYGAALELPDNPVGPGVGKAGLLDTVGEGHSVLAEISPTVRKSFGPDRPQYAADVVGGLNYGPGDVATALRAAGERVFAVKDAAGRGDVVAISPAPVRQSLWSRLLGRLRGQ